MHPHDRDGALVTRSTAAAILGRSIALVRKYERKGRLKPIRDRDGVHYFARAELEDLAKTLRGRESDGKEVPGEIAAQAFALFFDNASLALVVIKLRLQPAQVRALYREYQTPLGSVPAPELPPLGDYTARGRELDEEHRTKVRALKGGRR